MEKVVLFGAGNTGTRYYNNKDRKTDILAVIDNDESIQGTLFQEKIPIISIEDYIRNYHNYAIVIASVKYCEVIKQLELYNIDNYRIASEIYCAIDVAHDDDISHDNWVNYLSHSFNKNGVRVLEIGSRNVTGSCLREKFNQAEYIGFDYYPGENVDVVGDAHKLSSYFEQKFDLIFCSAVFEHLAMPWKVSMEIIKLLKVNGCVFIETHYSYSSHERPWHFFQFSENALDVLFPQKFGMECIKKGCSNLIEGRFSEYASEYLMGRLVGGLYCHSEYLGIKTKEIKDLSWDDIELEDVTKSTVYPKPRNFIK